MKTAIRKAALVAAVGLLGACGSTLETSAGTAGSEVELSPGSPGATTAASGGPAATGTGGAASSTATGLDGQVASGSASGAPGERAGQTPGGSGAAPGSPGATPANQRGLTDTAITIGVGTIDVAALAGAFAPGADVGDGPTVQESVQAIVDWMNRNGGIAGREIIPVYHDYPVNELVDSSAAPRREQAMCDDFTLDRPAFAAMPLVSAYGIFNSCAAERNLIAVDIANLGENVDTQRFAEIQNVWYRPNWVAGDHREEMIVAELHRRGFFNDARVGLLIDDSPVSRRTLENSLLPALARIGVTPVEVLSYRWNDDGQTAVLRFKTSGVTHVIWGSCPCGGLAQSTFMNAAETQGYHPMYALSTDLQPGAMPGIGASRNQMRNSVAFGWSPSYDGVTLDEPISEIDANCWAAMEEAGYDPPTSTNPYCEGLFFLKQGLEAAAELSPEGFRAAVEGFGGRYRPATTWATSFGPGRHDGAAAVRDMEFELECDCWRYTSSPHPFGG